MDYEECTEKSCVPVNKFELSAKAIGDQLQIQLTPEISKSVRDCAENAHQNITNSWPRCPRSTPKLFNFRFIRAFAYESNPNSILFKTIYIYIHMCIYTYIYTYTHA